MLADLVEVTTADGIPLSGAYFAPAGQDNVLPVDAFLFFHGDGGHFTAACTCGWGSSWRREGWPFCQRTDGATTWCPTGPRVGHWRVTHLKPWTSRESTTWPGWGCFGSEAPAYRHRRPQRGAVRAVYAQATERFSDVVGVIPVSPGEYDHETIVALHGEDFSSPFRESERHLAEGRPGTFLRPGVPFGAIWTARTYVDCFHRDNRYSVRARAAETGCPTRFIFGPRSAPAGRRSYRYAARPGGGLEASGHPNVEVNVIEGANHGYVDREAELTEMIYSYLQSL